MDRGGTAQETPSARPTLVEPDLQSAFDRDGYCRIPFLDEARLAAVRGVFADLGRAPDDPGEAVHFGFFSQDATWKREVREALRPIVAPLVEERFSSHRLVYAMFITKWPGDRSAFGPHRDPWFVDESRYRSATLWCPLVDTPPASGPDNGSLHFVPGSHRLTDTPRIHDASKLLFEGAQDLILDEYGFPVRLRAGQAVVFDNGIIHYSYRNASTAPRTVLALGLVPREAELYCLLPESASSIRAFSVDADYFIEHNPFSMAYGLGHYEAVAQLPFDPPQMGEDAFREWCDDAVARMDPDLRSAPLPRPTEDLSSDVFCFVCGGREGLEDHPDPEHASVMVVCTSCAADVDRRYSDREIPAPTRDIGMAEPQQIPPRSVAPVPVGADPWLASLHRDGFAVIAPSDDPDPIGSLAAALGDPDPIVLDGPADPVGGDPALAVAWTVVDEGAGQQAWILAAPPDRLVEVALVPGSHRVDPAPRGPGFAPPWTRDPAVRASARPVAVGPGEVLVIDPALLHRPLTRSAGWRRIVLALPGGAPGRHVRRLNDGRAAVYEVSRTWLASAPLYGDAALPPVCPLGIFDDVPQHPDPACVRGEIAPRVAAPAPPDDAAPVEPPGRRRRWSLARRASRRVAP
ncbi:MAG TPA: phytanoyl-CoA dioxygenase family protein [Microthrixaceae bacterium]|nr:phytanoyl-CoA dioxygenase family protein [Acidimicrobiales bacterium]HRW39946.1 phytanoyl-CoA dioxygenase family protein [Microthrixaceae bacterium]